MVALSYLVESASESLPGMPLTGGFGLNVFPDPGGCSQRNEDGLEVRGGLIVSARERKAGSVGRFHESSERGVREGGQVVCYRAGVETGELQRKNRKESKDHLPDSQAGMTSGFLHTQCLQVLVTETKEWVREEVLDPQKLLWSFLGVKAERKGMPL